MTEIIRGRPTIASSEVPPHIFEGLLHKSRGATWSDAATAAGGARHEQAARCRASGPPPASAQADQERRAQRRRSARAGKLV